MYLTTLHTKDFNKVLRYIIKYRLRYEDYFNIQTIYFSEDLLQYIESVYPNIHRIDFMIFDRPSLLKVEQSTTMRKVTFDLVFTNVLPNNIIVFKKELFNIDLTDSVLDSADSVFVTTKETFNLIDL